jgi:hypothetical protein
LGQFLGARNRQQWVRAVQDEPIQRLRSDGAAMDATILEQLRALGYAQ